MDITKYIGETTEYDKIPKVILKVILKMSLKVTI